MALGLDLIRNIFVVMMENRSFDHILGYRSLPPYQKDLDGLRDDASWLAAYANPFNGQSVRSFHFTGLTLSGDPPHERANMQIQIGADFPWPGGRAPMNGFVLNYGTAPSVPSGAAAEVMGYYTPAEVPMAHFLAENFAICDHWYSSLPASTQPNRLMAMGGYSDIDNTFSDTIPDQDLVYDWCERQQPPVRWRVYHQGWPFFMVMPRWRLRIIADAVAQESFRDLGRLEEDLRSDQAFPPLVFIEPKYTDDHFSLAPPSDDHPPTSIAAGQDFLRQVYGLIRNSKLWEHALLIVFYDENGGFFDHCSPLAVAAQIAGAPGFSTTGMRVPAFLASPFIRAGAVFQGPLDHTSLLRFVGEKFAADKTYSPQVSERARAGGVHLQSLSEALDAVGTNPAARTDCPQAPAWAPVPTPQTPAADRPLNANARAFEHALLQIRREQPQQGAIKFPYLARFFSDPGTWRLVQHEARAHGFSFDPDCQHLVRNLTEQVDLQLLKEPERAPLARSRLVEFVKAMIDQARATGSSVTIGASHFQSASSQLWPWPFNRG